MKKSILLVPLLALGGTLSSNINMIEDTNPSINEEIKKVDSNEGITTVTMKEFTEFLSTKKEHYPLSDEFIEKYQQTSGGYLDTARNMGLLVDKEQHEPNQKWHFFTSWFDASIKDGTVKLTDDPKNVVYNRLLCPELLLWIFEASGVNPTKVRKAKEVAEAGKASGTRVATIASNMRKEVPYEDIYNNVVKYLEAK